MLMDGRLFLPRTFMCKQVFIYVLDVGDKQLILDGTSCMPLILTTDGVIAYKSKYVPGTEACYRDGFVCQGYGLRSHVRLTTWYFALAFCWDLNLLQHGFLFSWADGSKIDVWCCSYPPASLWRKQGPMSKAINYLPAFLLYIKIYINHYQDNQESIEHRQTISLSLF